MRINKFIAASTELSRRGADEAIAEGRVFINSARPAPGQQVTAADIVTVDGVRVTPPTTTETIMFYKPAGYVCSRRGQGSRTIYDLLPERYQRLESIGRLDKESSGLLLLTNDGTLAQQLTHPSHRKIKVYTVKIDQPLQPLHHQFIADKGVQLEDGPSRLQLEKLDTTGNEWRVTMQEGRNRQIRRTFKSLGYEVTYLNRTQFGQYHLDNLAPGQIREVNP